jgi:Spy/CpxP family protein refolding chaperone
MMAGAAKAKLLVFAVFVVGAVTGALVDNVYQTRWSVDADSAPEQKSRREMDRVYDFLGLTDEQREQWRVITEESQAEFNKLLAENRKLTEPNQPRFEALQERTRGKIRAILTEDQRKKYNEFNERRRQERQPRPRTN